MKGIIEEKIKAVMLGHAVADALGVPVEFCSREELEEEPVTKMMGFGTYPVPEGCWSDDTSMALAALDSLAEGSVDLDKVMLNFGKWYYKDEYTPTNETFDVGNTCSFAIDNYFKAKKSVKECGLFGERSNGNGSLMRIHPFALMAHFKSMAFEGWVDLIARASSLTHAHARSVLACKIFTVVLFHLLHDPCKDSVRLALKRAQCHFGEESEFGHFARLVNVDFDKTEKSEIKSTGYVVDTLEAAIWCLLTTDSYMECVLKAVNLGDDTDTVGAVAGALAGALYGLDEIPKEWLAQLKRREYIEGLCQRAAENW